MIYIFLFLVLFVIECQSFLHIANIPQLKTLPSVRLCKLFSLPEASSCMDSLNKAQVIEAKPDHSSEDSEEAQPDPEEDDSEIDEHQPKDEIRKGKQNYLIYTSDILPSDIRIDVKANDFFEKAKEKASRYPSNSLLKKAQAKGMELLLKAKIPHFKDEAWRFTNIKRLFIPEADIISSPIITSDITSRINNYDQQINQYRDETCEGTQIVFIDGVYNQKLSQINKLPSEVKFITSLSNDDDSMDSSIFDKHLNNIPNEDCEIRFNYGSDLFVGLNLARMNDYGILEIDNNIDVSNHPIQCIFASTQPSIPSDQNTKDTSHLSNPHLLVKLGSSSKMKLKQTFISLNETNSSEENQTKPVIDWVNSFTSIDMGSNSSLEHSYFQELSEISRAVEVLSVSIHEHSNYILHCAQVGSAINRMNVHANMTGEYSDTKIKGVMFPCDQQSLALYGVINHLANHTTCDQLERVIVGEKGHGVFKGLITIPSDAQHSDGAQLCQGFLIGKDVELDAMPTLEIVAENCACSHGVAITDLDENSLFYLAARGFSRDLAKRILVKGHTSEILENAIKDEKCYDRVINKLKHIMEIDQSGFHNDQDFFSL